MNQTVMQVNAATPQPPVEDPPVKSPLPGMKVLLLGSSGTGKTHAIRTIVDAGYIPFVIFTEPSQHVLSDIPVEKLHWKYIPAAIPGGWDTFLQAGKRINNLTYKGITELPKTDAQHFTQYLDILNTCANFVCDRDGVSYGNIGNWGTDRVLVLDGLSGLSLMAQRLLIGSKPTLHEGEWGVVMNNLEMLINKLVLDTWAHFVLIAHPEREKDEITGGSSITVSTLGKKLGPKIPRYFDEVLMTIRNGNEFSWSAAESGADVKTRFLTFSKGLAPSYVPLFKEWERRGGVKERSQQPKP